MADHLQLDYSLRHEGYQPVASAYRAVHEEQDDGARVECQFPPRDNRYGPTSYGNEEGIPIRQHQDESRSRSRSHNRGKSNSPPRSILKNGTNKRNFESEDRDGYTEYFSQGCDRYGQLGHGQDPAIHDRDKFVCVPKSLSFDILIRLIACGARHSLMLSKSGELFSIGSNSLGQLGLNDRQLEFTTAPLLVQEFQNMATEISQIACGANHNLVLSTAGHLFSWGSNLKGECGQAPDTNIFTPQRLCSGVTQIDCGDNFSGFLTDSGTPYAFGDNSEGQLGIGQQLNQTHEPLRIACSEGIEQLSMGYKHSLFLTHRGDVYGAGLNSNHQLGLGNQPNAFERNFYHPVRIEALHNMGVTQVMAGGFSAALTQDHRILVWGEGEFGCFESQQQLYIDGVEFVDCKLGKFQSSSSAFAIDMNGKAYSWGHNNHGQLGHGDQRGRKLPIQVQSLKRKKITQVAIGESFTVMLGRDISIAEQMLKKQKKQARLEKQQHQKEMSQIDADRAYKKHASSKAEQHLDERSKSYERVPQTRTQRHYDDDREQQNSSDLLYRNLQPMTTPDKSSIQKHPSFGAIDRGNKGEPNQFPIEDHPDPTNQADNEDIIPQAMTYSAFKHTDYKTPNLDLSIHNNYAPPQRSARSGNKSHRSNRNIEDIGLAGRADLALKLQHNSEILSELQVRAEKSKEIIREARAAAGGSGHKVANRDRSKSPAMPLSPFSNQNHLSANKSELLRDASPNKIMTATDTQNWQDCFDVKLKSQNLEREVIILREQKLQLENQVQQVMSDNQKAYQQNDALIQQKEELQSTVNVYEDQQQNFQGQINSHKQRIGQMEAESEQMQNKHFEKEQQMTKDSHQLRTLVQDQRNKLEEQSKKLSEMLKLYENNETLNGELKRRNMELDEQVDQKDGRLAHQLQQMRDDEKKIQQLEEKFHDTDNYIQKILFESNEHKLKAHNNELAISTQKHAISKMEGLVQVMEQEKENHIDMLNMRERDMNQLETTVADLKATFERKVVRLTELKDQYQDESDETRKKNQKLTHLLNQKQIETQSHLAAIEDECLRRSQTQRENQRLEGLLQDMQRKNRQLGELLDQSMFNRAESYKSKVIEALQRPRSALAEGQEEKRQFDRGASPDPSRANTSDLAGASLMEKLKNLTNTDSSFNQKMTRPSKSMERQSQEMTMNHLEQRRPQPSQERQERPQEMMMNRLEYPQIMPESFIKGQSMQISSQVENQYSHENQQYSGEEYSQLQCSMKENKTDKSENREDDCKTSNDTQSHSHLDATDAPRFGLGERDDHNFAAKMSGMEGSMPLVEVQNFDHLHLRGQTITTDHMQNSTGTGQPDLSVSVTQNCSIHSPNTSGVGAAAINPYDPHAAREPPRFLAAAADHSHSQQPSYPSEISQAKTMEVYYDNSQNAYEPTQAMSQAHAGSSFAPSASATSAKQQYHAPDHTQSTSVGMGLPSANTINDQLLKIEAILAQNRNNDDTLNSFTVSSVPQGHNVTGSIIMSEQNI